MKALIRNISIMLSFFLFATNTFGKEPVNLTVVKDQIIHYYNSGEYFSDIKNTIQKAIVFIRERMPHFKYSHLKPAIVLDIDETALSNYKLMDRFNFGMIKKEFIQYEMQATAPAIPSTLELYKYVKANHIAVFFISGRPEWKRPQTVKNLKFAGYKHWDGLFLKTEQDMKVPDRIMKTKIRQQLVKQGYRIIANIGDQYSDIEGGFAEKAYKLPNPFYMIQTFSNQYERH